MVHCSCHLRRLERRIPDDRHHGSAPYWYVVRCQDRPIDTAGLQAVQLSQKRFVVAETNLQFCVILGDLRGDALKDLPHSFLFGMTFSPFIERKREREAQHDRHDFNEQGRWSNTRLFKPLTHGTT